MCRVRSWLLLVVALFAAVVSCPSPAANVGAAGADPAVGAGFVGAGGAGHGTDEPGIIPAYWYDSDRSRLDWLLYGVSPIIDWGLWFTRGTAIAGDWDGDGDDEPGYVGANLGDPTKMDWYLYGSANIIDWGPAHVVARDLVWDSYPTFAGDWDGDGDDEPGYMGAHRGDPEMRDWYLYGSANILDWGRADVLQDEAAKGDATQRDGTIAGDWDGDGDDEPGYVGIDVGDPTRPDWHLYGAADLIDWSFYGAWRGAIAGDWDGDGDDEPGTVGWSARRPPDGTSSSLDFYLYGVADIINLALPCCVAGTDYRDSLSPKQLAGNWDGR